NGSLLVGGTHGNWEAGGVCLRRVTNVPVAVVAMPEADPEVDRARREIRELIGADTIEVGQSLDTALQIRRRLAATGIVAFLMDRHVGRDRVEVQFLGRRAHFQRTPALMGFMTGAPLVPSFMERLGPSHFIVRAGVPIVVDRTRPRDEAVQAAAQAFADQLAARVREHPEFWYHFYRYWDGQDVPERVRRGVGNSSARAAPPSMDPLTHVVVGRAVVAAARDETRNHLIGAAAILGALSPDVDSVLAFSGWDRYVRAHQYGTHSLLGAM